MLTNSDGDFRRTFHTASRLGVPLPPSPAPLVPNPLHNREHELLWQRWLLSQKQAQENNVVVKRDFDDLQCRGMYDRRLLTRLERICEDCYDLYRDPEVHGYCRLGLVCTT